MKRPSGLRRVPFGALETGAIAYDEEGFWGVVVNANQSSIFRGTDDGGWRGGRILDRWDAPPTRLDVDDIVYVPTPRTVRPTRRVASEIYSAEVRPQ